MSLPSSLFGRGSKKIYSELTDSCAEEIRKASTAEGIQSRLSKYCESLRTETRGDFATLTQQINAAIPLIAELRYEKSGSTVSANHSKDKEDQLRKALPVEIFISVITTIQRLAAPKEVSRPELSSTPFKSTGSLGKDQGKLNEMKENGSLSKDQASTYIERIFDSISSLDSLARYVEAGENSPFKKPIITAKSFVMDPSKKLSELQEYLNSLDPSSGNLALIIRRVKVLAVQEWHKSHSIGVEGGKQINPDFVTQYRKAFEGMRKDSYSTEDIAGIIRQIDALVSRLSEYAFSTIELEDYKRRFGLFLDKDNAIRLEQNEDDPHGFGLGALYNSIFSYISRNNGLSAKKPEQATSSIEQRVSSATSINELFTIVRELGTIPSSQGDFPAQEVIDNINNYFSGKLRITFIPSRYGIRDAAQRLKPQTLSGSITERGNENPTFDQVVSRARSIDELKAIIRDSRNKSYIEATALQPNEMITDIEQYIDQGSRNRDLLLIASQFGIRKKVAELIPPRP